MFAFGKLSSRWSSPAVLLAVICGLGGCVDTGDPSTEEAEQDVICQVPSDPFTAAVVCPPPPTPTPTPSPSPSPSPLPKPPPQEP